MKIFNTKDISIKDYYREDWPPIEFVVDSSRLKHDVVEGFRALIESEEGESKIDKYITENPVLLTTVLNLKTTGHHAAWVVPKKIIGSHVSEDTPGLIPDFLVGGRNSYGITWYVIELKAPKHKLFAQSKNNRLHLSNFANKGLCQVLEYMHFCNTYQSNLRDGLKLHGFVSADAFLFIGRDYETEAIRKKNLKAAFNHINSHLQIRSYDALLRSCDTILDSGKRK